MGVLIILGTALVIGVVIHRLYAKPVVASMTPAVWTPLPKAFNRLPPDSHISGLAAAGGEFAIWVTAPGGDSVYLLSPQTGELQLALSAPK